MKVTMVLIDTMLTMKVIMVVNDHESDHGDVDHEGDHGDDINVTMKVIMVVMTMKIIMVLIVMMLMITVLPLTFKSFKNHLQKKSEGEFLKDLKDK